MARTKAPGKARWLGPALAFGLKALVTALVVAIPVLGVWGASALAAFFNGPVWLAVLSGAALFPGLPLAWDGVAKWRRSRRETKRKQEKKAPLRPPILTFWDRLIVRTFVLNALFLGAFLALWPKAIFTALSTRGDWMLESVEGDAVDTARRLLLQGADGLSWLYEAANENPYAEYAPDTDLPTPSPNAGLGRAEPSDSDRTGDVAPAPVDDPAPNTEDSGGAPVADQGSLVGQGAPGGETPSGRGGSAEQQGEGARTDAPTEPLRWPLRAELHPLVRDMRPEHERSIQTVARYLADNEPDPFMRMKALHDYVADRVAYDAVALASGDFPPQDAVTVFTTRKAVCAGYARLAAALGQEMGERVVYVVGNARLKPDEIDGTSHAWNALEIEGGWYLMDVTWDAGTVQGETFTKRYRTTNFLTPPDVFGIRHFPDDAAWQLREQPLSRGEFNRQPMLRPEFYALGMKLVEPDRSQVDVDGKLTVRVENPQGMHMMASYAPVHFLDHGDCAVERTGTIVVQCTFPGPGRYEVTLFASHVQFGTYSGVGSILANSD